MLNKRGSQKWLPFSMEGEAMTLYNEFEYSESLYGTPVYDPVELSADVDASIELSGELIIDSAITGSVILD